MQEVEEGSPLSDDEDGRKGATDMRTEAGGDGSRGGT
jgi:hypothetical protein